MGMEEEATAEGRSEQPQMEEGQQGRHPGPWRGVRRGIWFLAIVGVIATGLGVLVLRGSTYVFLPEHSISAYLFAGYPRGCSWIVEMLALSLSPLAPLSIAAALIVIILLLPLAVVAKRGRSTILVLIFIGLAFGEVHAIARVENALYRQCRRRAYAALAERSKPLVDAIERYASVKGVYPPDLPSLVPEFLDQVPYTGLVGLGARNYRYCLRSDANTQAGAYELTVKVQRDLLTEEVFVYWQSHGYPEEEYGGTPVAFGSWVHMRRRP